MEHNAHCTRVIRARECTLDPINSVSTLEFRARWITYKGCPCCMPLHWHDPRRCTIASPRREVTLRRSGAFVRSFTLTGQGSADGFAAKNESTSSRARHTDGDEFLIDHSHAPRIPPAVKLQNVISYQFISVPPLFMYTSTFSVMRRLRAAACLR